MYIATTPASQTTHIQLRYPGGFTTTSCLEERNQEIRFTNGSIKINECWFDGICLIHSVHDSIRPFTIIFDYPKPCRVMFFTLDGQIEIGLGKMFMKTTKDNGYSAHREGLNTSSILFHKASVVLAICLDETFIDKLFIQGILPADVKNHLDNFIKKDLKAKLQVIIKHILDAGQTSYIKRLLLEAGIVELLIKQHQPDETNMLPAFSDADKARLLEAKNIVEQNLKHPCSLIELSRKTGLNDFKLKKGFKALFGNTVFGYLAERRMALAHKLLKEGRSVSEVAETVGYKNAHHFTATFKKHFDMLPSKVSKLMFILMGCYTWM
jgi:AraC-like DNA-binding protein